MTPHNPRRHTGAKMEGNGWKSPYISQKSSSSSRNRTAEGKILFNAKKTTVETREGEVFYIYETRTRGFVHGDMVAIEVTRKGGEGKLPEARPTRLLRRSEEPLIMEVIETRGKQKYKIIDELGGLEVKNEEPLPGASPGDLYIVQYGPKDKVRIIKSFGNRKNPDTEEKIILFRHGIRLEWPSAFEKLQVKKLAHIAESRSFPYEKVFQFEGTLPSQLQLSDRSLFPRIKLDERERADFRKWPTITIDGADAKDLDDAISLACYENGDYLLGVHIADVAEYVEEDTPLDREALLRGTSVYTPGRVVPMLPEILSNDRCSLHPGEPKAVLSILIRLNSLGQVKESYITEGIIESIHRATYDEVGDLKNKGDIATLKNSPWHAMLPHVWELYDALTLRRKKEGKILFEMTECYFVVDENRNVKEIRKRDRNDAHMLIEECMVLANEEVAKWCIKQKFPFLSRVHDTPGVDNMKIIAEIIEQKSLSESLEPRHIREYLDKTEDPLVRYRLSRLLLPKMTKAVYADAPIRHFGLALTYYAHFTSPIRRYPDLLVHRLIKGFLHGKLDSKTKARYSKEMKKWGKSLTEREKQAEDAERAIDSLMMCRYMKGTEGQEFDGVISGVAEHGIYVELESGVEGSVFFGKGNVKYILDPIQGSLLDASKREKYRIGHPIHVKILEVDMLNRRVEMMEVNDG